MKATIVRRTGGMSVRRAQNLLLDPDRLVDQTFDTLKIMEARVVDLEIRYTHLERQYTELSQIVFEQQKAIAALQKDLTALRGRLEEVGDPISNERPPHY